MRATTREGPADLAVIWCSQPVPTVFDVLDAQQLNAAFLAAESVSVDARTQVLKSSTVSPVFRKREIRFGSHTDARSNFVHRDTAVARIDENRPRGFK